MGKRGVFLVAGSTPQAEVHMYVTWRTGTGADWSLGALIFPSMLNEMIS